MRLFLFLSFAVSILCHAQTYQKYDFHLDGCLTETDLDELDNALTFFESQIQIRYQDQNLSEAYFSYLESLYVPGNTETNFEFLLNKEAVKIIGHLKDSNTFDKIWISLCEAVAQLRDEEGNPILNDPDNDKLVIINKDGAYQRCVKSSTGSITIKRYIDFEIENPGLSFPLSARFLRRNLKKKELDDDVNRLVIALGFYYEYIFMMQNYYGE